MIERGQTTGVAIVRVQSWLYANDYLAFGAVECPFIARDPVTEGNDPMRHELGWVARLSMRA